VDLVLLLGFMELSYLVFLPLCLGGTPTQISGPTGPMTVVIASSVLTFGQDMASLAAVILLAGAFQILFGLLRVGKYVQYIPYPVISGFMSGIGVIIIILQINPYFGLQNEASIIHVLLSLPKNVMQMNFDAFLLATATLAIMFLTPKKISKIFPTPLIALISLTPLSLLIGLDIPTIGKIPSDLPDFIMPEISLSNYSVILPIAFTLAVLGMIDTLLTSIVADSITRTKHKPNKELLGQGIGNMICSFFGALPGAGATMRTVVNVKSGGSNKLSGIFHSIILLCTLLFLLRTPL
jgi:SulP family sulfate permease